MSLISIVCSFLGQGVLVFGDLPFIETSYSHNFVSTWIDYGAHDGLETLSRYPFITL